MTKEELINKLDSKNKNEVRDAILKLENFEDENVVKKIVNTILNIKSKIILEAGLETLLNFKNKKIIANNAVKFIFSDSPKIRHAGITILVSCGEDAFEIIKKELLNNNDFNIRKHALDILKEIKSEKSIDIIKELLNDSNPNVKYSAVEFLMEFTKFKDKVIEILLDFIKKENFDSLYAATTVASTIIYGNYFDKKFIPAIREKIKKITDDNIKHWLYKILIYLGDNEIIEEAKENAKKIDMLNVIENDISIAGKK